MKLIIQSDDLGMTEAVSCGIAAGIRAGKITATGLFTNMPASGFAAQLVKDYDIALGEDINIVAGDPVSDPAAVPGLVDEAGHFLSSRRHREIDAANGGKDTLDYDQCLRETEAQVRQFIRLVGRKPVYLHGHSYGTPTLGRAMHDVSEKYGIPITFDLFEKYHIGKWRKSWYAAPFPPEVQLRTDPLDIILDDDLAPLDAEVALLGTHCGYVDGSLFDYTSYTLIRFRDLGALLDPRFDAWLENHQIQLTDYRWLLRQAA